MTKESIITVGCDPEFFIQSSNSSNGEVTPVCGLIGGTKHAPRKLRKDSPEGFYVQEDGIACEFNIPPCDNAENFNQAIMYSKDVIAEQLAQQGFMRHTGVCVQLKPEWITKFPNIEQIGCDPDYSAYDEHGSARQLDMTKIGQSRGAGGHIHLGYPGGLCPPAIMAKLLDCALAVPLIDDDVQEGRRSWWGQAGLYRPKKYGMEYRTLSNFWIWDQDQTRTVGAIALSLVKSLQKNMISWQAFFNTQNWDQIRDCIYREDVKLGKTLLRGFMGHRVYDEMQRDARTHAAGGELK